MNQEATFEKLIANVLTVFAEERARERNECAQLCDDRAKKFRASIEANGRDRYDTGGEVAADILARAIRARGNEQKPDAVSLQAAVSLCFRICLATLKST